MQKAIWRFYNQCAFVKSVAGVIMLFLFGSGYAGLGVYSHVQISLSFVPSCLCGLSLDGSGYAGLGCWNNSTRPPMIANGRI